MKNLFVEHDACIGCGACQAIEESVFEINDDGFAEVKEGIVYEKLTDEIKENVRDAVDGCPTSAIVLTEIGNEQEKN